MWTSETVTRSPVFVDSHTHCQQAGHFGRPFTESWERAGYAPWPEVDPRDFAEEMRGVDRVIVFGIHASAVDVYVPNDYVAQFVSHDPDKYIGFMALDPSRPDALDEMERCATDLGLRGIKLYPVMARFDPLDEKLTPFYARASELRLPLLWHMGASPVAAGRLRYSLPILVDDIAATFPDLPMILAHLAHPWQRDAVVVMRKNPLVYADISGLWKRPYQGYDALLICHEWEVLDKLLFGSDYPIWTPTEAVAALRTLVADGIQRGLPALPDDFIDQLLARDTLALLGLSDT